MFYVSRHSWGFILQLAKISKNLIEWRLESKSPLWASLWVKVTEKELQLRFKIGIAYLESLLVNPIHVHNFRNAQRSLTPLSFIFNSQIQFLLWVKWEFSELGVKILKSSGFVSGERLKLGLRSRFTITPISLTFD